MPYHTLNCFLDAKFNRKISLSGLKKFGVKCREALPGEKNL